MEPDQAREFYRHHHHAVLATRTRTGGIQQSPVLVAVDEKGRFIISSRETAFKAKNLRRDPRAHLCVFSDKFFGEWIYVEGTVDVLSLPEAMEPSVEPRMLAGEHHDWDEYRQSMQQEQRVILRIDATRAGPDRQS